MRTSFSKMMLNEYSSRIVFLPFFPSVSRSVESSRSRNVLLWKELSGPMRPFFSFWMMLETPGESRATIGVSQDIASRSDLGHPSWREGNAHIFAEL